ncbi:MAG: 5'/3'-nucleotidase SurE [Thiolinea sp.]
MNILLSNDDGYQAPGLQALRQALRSDHHITTVAPDRDRSGASNSLTLDRPLSMRDQGEQVFSVNGTPTDCVYLGLAGLDLNPDIVISGINNGPNLGDDVLYSGTVAAAIEGRFYGHTAIAVSMGTHSTEHLDSAVIAIKQLLTQIHTFPEQGNLILNVNVPSLPWEEIKGFKISRLGQRHSTKAVVRDTDPRGREIFWIGAVAEAEDDGEGTDFHTLEQGYIAVTPLHTDLTRHQALDNTAKWLTGVDIGKA